MTQRDDDELEALLESATVGHEATLIDGVLSADDFDGSESVAARARHEEPDFDQGRTSGDRVNGRLLAPDQGGNDRTAELIATEYPADGPLSPEEAALHRNPG